MSKGRMCSQWLITSLALIWSAAGTGFVSAATLYVSKSGNDGNNGQSWTEAKLTVQAGLNAAVSGDQVWVAAGTYVEKITLKSGVVLYGGFAATEIYLSQRNWNTCPTILDGNQSGTVVIVPSGATLNTRIDGFIIRNGSNGGISCSSSSPMIVNNRIIGNIASAGGGIYCYSSSPMIADNIIISNVATSSSGGGGIYCKSGSPMIINNIITSNHASIGAGIRSSMSNITMINTIVAFNASGVYATGGTITFRYNCVYGNVGYNYSGISDPTGINGNISVDPQLTSLAYGNLHLQPNSPCVNTGDNTATQSGWVDMDGQPRIIGGHVDIGADESDGTMHSPGPTVIVRISPDGNDGNDGSSWALAKRTVQAGIEATALHGGEVWVRTGTYKIQIKLWSYVYVYGGFAGTENNRNERDWITNPTILDGQQGGSVVTARASYQVSSIDGFIIRNGCNSQGGGVYCSHSAPLIAHNKFTDNTSTNVGGAIYCIASSPVIANNAITGNSGFSAGGGIYCMNSSPTIINNTIIGNYADYGGGICCIDGSPLIANSIVAFNSSGVAVPTSSILRHNCVYDNNAYNYSGISDPTGSNGNISADPELADLAFGNVHIQSYSPCVDAGGNAYVFGELDMDGQSRIQPAEGTVDIGADESDGSDWPAGPYTIIRVAPDGNDAHGGSSWALAKRTVQAGIDAASTLGGEVWVKAGTYNERITLHPYAYLYGGFVGMEDARDERNWIAHATILDGQQAGSVVTARSGYHVNTIDGFTIRNGSGYVSPSGNSPLGGGIYCSYASPTVMNNKVEGNIALYGAGIYCCHAFPKIANNKIVDNKAAGENYGYGGGIYCSFSSPTICDTIIMDNFASYGGGIYCCNESAPIIKTNSIMGNRVPDSSSTAGGGICCSSSSPMILNNTIIGNSAASGGGISCSSSSPTIANNRINGNSAIYSDGGGLHCGSNSNATIINNTIIGNSALNGGGISCYASSPVIINTITAFNSSGIYSWGTGSPALKYNCVHGNDAYNYLGISDPTGINGNISVDPLLADSTYGNVHLQPDSPCVDTGDNSVVQVNWRDVDDEERIMGGHVDIGVDESDGTEYPPGPYAIVRVDPEGNDSNDGSSWNLAVRTVQAGIDAATLLGGEVWVKAGTYYERINLRSYAYVYGGFTGFENARAQRNWAAQITILDGRQDGSVVTIRAGQHISTLDGVTIQKGNGTVMGMCRYGGGIYCQGGSPVIINNTITGNVLSASDKNYGAAIYCGHANASIINNIITDNRTINSAYSYGGGIYCHRSTLLVMNNKITGNAVTGTSSSCGGAIYTSYSSATVLHNIISDNNASSSGGGIYSDYDLSTIIANNIISKNRANSTGGGGILCYYTAPVITNNSITENETVSGAGGAIFCFYASPIITNNTIACNESRSYRGGGICCTSCSAAVFNNTLTDNRATDGGGIYCTYSSPIIANNTITGNTATTNGGGISAAYSSPIISNTIIAFNSSGIYNSGGTPTLRYNCVYGNPAYNYSGITDPTGADGNISADPRFVQVDPGSDGIWGTADDDYSDLRLLADSPCIDAGDNATVPAEVTTDLDGNARVINCLVDMGTYEVDYGLPSPFAADFDNECDVDQGDFSIFAACATAPNVPYDPMALPASPPGCPLTPDGTGRIAADFDRDGDVDQEDFGIFQRCYSGEGQPVDPACAG